MRDLSKLLLALIALGAGAPSPAQEDARTYDRVDLSASAERAIDNDLLVAVVFAEVEHNDQAEAADGVNTAIQWAVERARRVAGVELQTAQYSTRPLYANGRRIVGWAARQSLRLESQDAAALSQLLGELQERVSIQSLRYDLSKAVRDAAEDALIAEALQAFERRAALVAEELDRGGFRIVRIGISSGGGPTPFYRQSVAEVAVADVAAPSIEAGVQTLSVSVNGTVELDASR